MALSYDVLRNRDFRRLMVTRLCGIFALQAQAVIVGWQVYSITKDPFMLGLVGLAEAVPAIACAMFAGHIVDISRPHRVFLNCLGVHTIISLMLLLVAGGIVGLSENMILYALFGGIFLSGLTRSFIMPASFTLLPRIVPRHDIPAASAWMSSGFQLAAIGGPAIAGIIYGGYGSTVAWCIPLFFMVCAFVALGGIGKPHREYKGAERREPAMQSIMAGWKFVFQNKVILPVMALDMFAVLFGGAVAILPVFADQVLHTGSEGLGVLRAAPAIGSIVSALYFALNPMKEIRGTRLLWVVTGFGICMLAFGLSTTFFWAAVFLVLSGAFDSVSMVIRGTLMQLLIPDTMRGRVSSLNSMFIISSNEIGAFRAGTTAGLMGLIPSILLGGTMTLLVAAVTTGFCPQLRKLVVHADRKEGA